MFGAVSIFLWLIAGFLILEYVIAYFIKQIMIMDLKRKCEGKLILTYDDGPGPVLEENLIKILNEHGVRATFFLNGMRAELFPGQCDFLIENEQELGCHCHTHFNAYKNTPWAALADIRRAYVILEKWVVRDKIFRPPHGKITLSMILFLMKKGVRIIFWTIDSGDTYQNLPRPELVVERVIKENGGVVLMHSFDREPMDGGVRSEYVVSLTKKLLMAAREHRLQVSTIREIFQPMA